MKYFFNILCLLLANMLHAQTFLGIEAGYTVNDMNTDISNRSFTRIRPEAGYSIGIAFRNRFRKYFTFQTGPGLTKKSYSSVRTGAYSGMYETYVNTYLQMPVQVGIEIPIKKFSAGLNIGLFGSYWLWGKIKGSIPNLLNIETVIDNNGQINDNLISDSYSQRYRFNPEKDNRFEAGWVTSINLMWHIKQAVSPFASCIYYQSLTDQQRKYMQIQAPKYNQTFSLSVGLMVQVSGN